MTHRPDRAARVPANFDNPTRRAYLHRLAPNLRSVATEKNGLKDALPDSPLALLMQSMVGRLQPTLDKGEVTRLASLADELRAAEDLAEEAYLEASKRIPPSGW